MLQAGILPEQAALYWLGRLSDSWLINNGRANSIQPVAAGSVEAWVSGHGCVSGGGWTYLVGGAWSDDGRAVAVRRGERGVVCTEELLVIVFAGWPPGYTSLRAARALHSAACTTTTTAGTTF